MSEFAFNRMNKRIIVRITFNRQLRQSVAMIAFQLVLATLAIATPVLRRADPSSGQYCPGNLVQPYLPATDAVAISKQRQSVNKLLDTADQDRAGQVLWQYLSSREDHAQ